MTQRLIGTLALATLGVACGNSGDRNQEPKTAETQQAITSIELSTTAPDCTSMTYRGRKLFGCFRDAPVGPIGGSLPPTEWGMCGLSKIDQMSDAVSVVRIEVGPTGYYRLLIGRYGLGSDLSAAMNCVKMTDFSGLPAVTSAHATGEYSVGSGDAPEPSEIFAFRKVYLHGGYATDACRWSGFDRRVNSPNYIENQFSGTRFHTSKGWTVDAIAFTPAHDYDSFSHCDGYVPGHLWTYSDPVQTWQSGDVAGIISQYPYTADVVLPVTWDSHFCWLTGVAGRYPQTRAELGAVVDPGSGIASWSYRGFDWTTNSGIQCLAYAQ